MEFIKWDIETKDSIRFIVVIDNKEIQGKFNPQDKSIEYNGSEPALFREHEKQILEGCKKEDTKYWNRIFGEYK